MRITRGNITVEAPTVEETLELARSMREWRGLYPTDGSAAELKCKFGFRDCRTATTSSADYCLGCSEDNRNFFLATQPTIPCLGGECPCAMRAAGKPSRLAGASCRSCIDAGCDRDPGPLPCRCTP